MKIYPRHQIDIKIYDLLIGLLSYFVPLNRQQLEKDILSFWKLKKHVKVCFTVRTAIDSFFSSLNLPKGTEVIMSAINIKDIVEILESHGLKIVPADLQIEDLSLVPEKLEALVSEKSKVLVFAQLFGAVVDLQPLAEICAKYNIILIEDCAQGFCGTIYQGSPFADISLFSFGPIKSLTALGGAVVISKSAEYIQKIEQIEGSYKNKGEYWFFRRIIKYIFIKLASFPSSYGLLIKLIVLCRYDLEATINGFSRSFSKGQLISQIRFKPPLHLLFLLRRRLRNNCDNMFGLRKQEAYLFLENLKSYVTVPSMKALFHSFWVIPILADNPIMLQKKLLKNGFDSTKANHSQRVIKVSEGSEYYVKNAQYIMNKVIYLPNLKGMREKDKKKLIFILKSDNKEIQRMLSHR